MKLLYFVFRSGCLFQAPSQGVQMGAMHQLGMCDMSMTNMLIGPIKKMSDTLPNPRVASVETPCLETNHFQKRYIYYVRI